MATSTAMPISDQIIYGGCWVILLLYIITTLLVFTQRSRASYAASFLFACALWLDLTVFNLWFLLPALIRHAGEFGTKVYHIFHTSGSSSSNVGSALLVEVSTECLRALVDSYVLEDLGLMFLGWLASSLSISNSLSMLEAEGCEAAAEMHEHQAIERWIIRWSGYVRDYVGIGESNRASGIVLGEAGQDGGLGLRQRASPSVIFAIPRILHAYIPLPRHVRRHFQNGSDEIKDEKSGIRWKNSIDAV